MTSTIPIVFYSGIDVVKSGLVASINRPGGNLTGIAALQAQLIAKRIELLSETVRMAQIVTLLVNPTNRYTDTETEILYGGARSLNLQLHVVRATSATEFEAAFKEIKNLQTEALLVSADLFLHSQREKLVSLVSSHGAADHLSLARICNCWRVDELRSKLIGRKPVNRNLQRKNPQRC